MSIDLLASEVEAEAGASVLALASGALVPLASGVFLPNMVDLMELFLMPKVKVFGGCLPAIASGLVFVFGSVVRWW